MQSSRSRFLADAAYFFVLVLLIALVAHGTYLRVTRVHGEGVSQVAFAYDHQLESKALGELAELGGSTATLVAFLPEGAPTSRTLYLSSIARYHQRNGLKVFGIASAPQLSFPWSKPPGSNAYDFPVIVDRGARLHSAFRVPPDHGHGGMALLDSQNRIKFHSFEIPPPDDLRQIVEKYTVGHVDYEYRPRGLPPFAVGQPFPYGSFRPFDSSDEPSPAPKGAALVFFPPGCSACQLDTYSSQLALFSGRPLAGRRPGLVAVFPGTSESAERSSLMQELRPLVSQVWLPRAPDLVWNSYYTRYLPEDAGPYLVITNDHGRVEFASTLRDFLTEDVR